MKLFNARSRLNIANFSFLIDLLAAGTAYLHDYVIAAESINSFKNCLNNNNGQL